MRGVDPALPRETVTAGVPAGVMFADLSGRVAAVEVHSAAHFVDCTFTDNAVTGTDVGVITAVSGKVWLQGCQFANNTASPALVALPSSVFYNDGPDKYYAVGGATEVQPKKAPLDTSAFLALPDNFVTDASGVRPLLLIPCHAMVAPLVSPQSRGGFVEGCSRESAMQLTCLSAKGLATCRSWGCSCNWSLQIRPPRGHRWPRQP